jgi:hypothetical protein
MAKVTKKTKKGAKKVAKKTTRRKARRRKVRYERRTFMFDRQTDRDTSFIQDGLRAPTASEAMRFTVRKMAELMQHVAAGGKVYVEFGTKRRPIEVDIPSATTAAAAGAGG